MKYLKNLIFSFFILFVLSIIYLISLNSELIFFIIFIIFSSILLIKNRTKLKEIVKNNYIKIIFILLINLILVLGIYKVDIYYLIYVIGTLIGSILLFSLFDNRKNKYYAIMFIPILEFGFNILDICFFKSIYLNLPFLIYLDFIILIFSEYHFIKKCDNSYIFLPFIITNILLYNQSYIFIALFISIVLCIYFSFYKSYRKRSIKYFFGFSILFIISLFISKNLNFSKQFIMNPYVFNVLINLVLFLILSKSKKNELISVIMATYNTEKSFLNSAIESILNQSYHNFEFIIVCDGNKDEYDYLKDKYKDKRIKLILNDENRGLPYSLNRAIKESKGKYIARMDSDDIAISNRLEISINHLIENKNLKLVAMYAEKFYDVNEPMGVFFWKNKYIKTQLVYLNCFVHPTVMFEKEYFVNNDLWYDEKFLCSQDYRLWTSIKENVCEVIPLVGLHYRTHSMQISTKKSEKQKIARKNILNSILENYQINFDGDEVTYLEILGGKIKLDRNNYLKLSDFIDYLLQNIFTDSSSKILLYNRYTQLLLKNKLLNINILKNKKVLKKVFYYGNLLIILQLYENIYNQIIKKVENIMNKLKLIYFKVLFKLNEKKILCLSDKLYLKSRYYITFKKDLNLNNPSTFNEKLQWLKLYNRKNEYTKWVDKYEVRDYISKIIGEEYLIPIIGVYEKFDDIDFDSLPSQFVIKCTHDSASVIVCKDKEKFNILEAKKKINKSLNENYFYRGREWPYKNVKPRVIIEKYMVDDVHKELIDYKFMCFNGEPSIIFTCTERFSKEGLKVTFFDKEWNKLSIERHYPSSDKKINKPKNYDKMIEYSKKLSKNIPFVRLDWYEINGRLYFGEITFFPGSGFEKFNNSNDDLKLGEMINLSNVNKE